MPRYRVTALLAFSTALLAAGALAAGARGELRSRTFKFTYTATVKEIPAAAGTVDLWIPYPRSDPHQTIHSVTVNAPGPVTIAREPQKGDQVFHFRQARPTGPVSVSVEVLATRRENA